MNPNAAYLEESILLGAQADLAGDELNVDILCAALHVEQQRREREAAMTPIERLKAKPPGEELSSRVWSSVELRNTLAVYDKVIRHKRNLDEAARMVGLPSGLDLCLEIMLMERVLRARGNE